MSNSLNLGNGEDLVVAVDGSITFCDNWGVRYELDPKDDITSYESALISYILLLSIVHARMRLPNRTFTLLSNYNLLKQTRKLP